MNRNLKYRSSFISCTGIILILICLIGCNNEAPTEARKFMAGLRNNHGSRFEVFVSGLRSMDESQRDTAVKRFISTFPNTPIIEKDSVVSLYWFGKSKYVFINGDLQYGWAAPDTMEMVPCGENRFFFRTYTVPADARLDYQFTIDTTVTTDPRNPSVTPSGYGPHSEIAMPGFKPDPVRQFRIDVPHGTVGSMLFTSRDTSIKPRQVKIYVPAGYKDLSHLPVLYVLDGLEAMEYMSYPNVLDNLIADRKISPVLVVFIPPAERFPEFIGIKNHSFMNAICNELVPLIDRKFRTVREPAHRGITGISAGGYMALLTVMSRPGTFLCGAGQSPTLTDQFYRSFHSFLMMDKMRQLIRLYFDVGRFDLPGGAFSNLSFLEANKNLDGEMKKAKINHVFRVFNDGHEWANWRERTDDILVYFFGQDQ
jgi:enterochelin esterase-like enzyme